MMITKKFNFILEADDEEFYLPIKADDAKISIKKESAIIAEADEALTRVELNNMFGAE